MRAAYLGNPNPTSRCPAASGNLQRFGTGVGVLVFVGVGLGVKVRVIVGGTMVEVGVIDTGVVAGVPHPARERNTNVTLISWVCTL